ncbi:MAG: hypothetical protein JOZ71_13930 [Ktedonobacteraceae bacterium]|nr:hypothetical protein [Ktedonobacteraceae bacterium]
MLHMNGCKKNDTMILCFTVISCVQNCLSEAIMFRDVVTIKGFRSLLLQMLIALILGALVFSTLVYRQQQNMKQNTQKPEGVTTVTIDLSSQIGTSQFMIGVTRTQLDQGPMTPLGHQLMREAVAIQNVFINGWGTSDPEPSKGHYDWSSLDARVKDIQSDGSQAIISLCCAPDWMKGSSNIEAAPLPQHYSDFAQLAAQVVARYRTVKIFQVWNELKGFNGNYQVYTTLYNDVYDAVKAVRPDAKLGGPYLGVLPGLPAEDRAVYTYWLNNKLGGDYILLDGGPLLGARTDEFNSTFFSDWINWIREQPYGGATLPIGWAEAYTRGLPDNSSISANHYNATFADDTISNIKLGVSYALQWGASSPHGVTENPDIPETMMTDSGQPTPMFYSMKDFKNYFGPGTPLYRTAVSSPNVTALASRAKTMLVNHLPSNQIITVNGTTLNLAPYEVLIINTSGG